MDLWIRSQDKLKLVKGTQLKIEFSDDYNKATNSYRSWLIKDGGIKLGKYKSKERAEKVLDEINNYKDELEKAWFLGMTESKFVSSTFIMPED